MSESAISQIIAVIFSAGILYSKISTVEKKVEKIDKHSEDIASLKSDVSNLKKEIYR